MKLIRIVTVGQHLSDVLQRRSICGINERSKIGIGLSPGLSPDPKSGEQSRSVVNEIVGGVHNEVVRGVRRAEPDVRPDLLLCLLLELTESAHALTVFHRLLRRSPGLGHQGSGDAFTGVIFDVDGRCRATARDRLDSSVGTAT